MDMFEHKLEEQMKEEAPLAARMRPATFNDFVGQEHLIGEGRVLRMITISKCYLEEYSIYML